ncbi:MAG: hypothetical protein IPO06_29625 [Leptospiraceae bacterium]|nr:hypothetical protein [Leptospiraceae bacterium]
MIKGNAILKVYLVILRHTIGFQQDSIQLSNSTIGEKTDLSTSEVIRVERELKDKYKLIDYQSTTGGRAIKNIKILLPEKFYSKENPYLDEARKLLEANGFKVEAPEDKSKQEKNKPVQTELKNNINSSTGLIIKYRFEKTLDKKYYDAFFEPCKFYLDGVFLFVICPSTLIKNHIIKKYSRELQAVAEEITKQKIVLKIQLKEGDK